MSTIERAAKLLESSNGPDATREADLIPRAFGGSNNQVEIDGPVAVEPRLDLIERAVGENLEQSGRIEPGEFIASAKTIEPAKESGARGKPELPKDRVARKLQLDLDQLRRQRIITPDGQRSPISESFRRIKRQILANVASDRSAVPANLILVTSALEGEGKTFCSLNLAISIALEMDYRVLLVDADVAKPSIPKVLGLKAERGLMDVLADRQVTLGDVLWNTNIGKLTLLLAGTAHPHATELLASDAMRSLVREMAGRYQDRVIIFDAPPLLVASEAGALASQVGQIVMIVEAERTPQSALKAALSHVDANKVTGLVLNKGPAPRRGYAYGAYG